MDMKSRHGTRVNGVRVQRVDLHDGDKIQAGKTLFRIAIQATAAVPTADPERLRLNPTFATASPPSGSSSPKAAPLKRNKEPLVSTAAPAGPATSAKSSGAQSICLGCGASTGNVKRKLCASCVADARSTGKRRRMGTPAYMSPEQAAGVLDNVKEPTDQYSLCGFLFQRVIQAPPVDVGSGDVAVLPVLAAIEDRRDMWVLQSCHGPGFTQEPINPNGVARSVGPGNLQCNFTLQDRIERKIDRAEAAAANSFPY